MTAKTITTNAGSPFIYDKDYEAIADKIDTLGQIKKTSQDTYGMAVDYWVRTNAEGTHIILQGNVLTETTNEREIGVDKDGKEVQLYTVTITTTYTTDDGKEESISDVAAVYAYTSENGGTEYRNANTHSVVINADGSSGIQNSTVSTPIERFKEVTVVVGYEGENRVWNDNEFIDADSTRDSRNTASAFSATSELRSLTQMRNPQPTEKWLQLQNWTLTKNTKKTVKLLFRLFSLMTEVPTLRKQLQQKADLRFVLLKRTHPQCLQLLFILTVPILQTRTFFLQTIFRDSLISSSERLKNLNLSETKNLRLKREALLLLQQRIRQTIRKATLLSISISMKMMI